LALATPRMHVPARALRGDAAGCPERHGDARHGYRAPARRGGGRGSSRRAANACRSVAGAASAALCAALLAVREKADPLAPAQNTRMAWDGRSRWVETLTPTPQWPALCSDATTGSQPSLSGGSRRCADASESSARRTGSLHRLRADTPGV
jgi:hypothetical protein